MLILNQDDSDGVHTDSCDSDSLTTCSRDTRTSLKADSSTIKSSLRNSRSSNIIIRDEELKEHSDDEWYPPTPPLYDVTDKLKEINTRDNQDGFSTDHVQSSIRWKKEIVQVKFIENNERNPPPRNTDETVNGLRFGVYNGSCNPFIKQQGSEPESEAPSLNFIEKICAIDDLCLNDISLQESKINSDSHAPAKFDNSEKVAHNSNFHSELLSTTVSKKSELAISPVIEEASRISNNETDTASEISEIPSDEEKEREEERKPEDDKIVQSKIQTPCDNRPGQVPNNLESNIKEEEEDKDFKCDEKYSSFDEESQSSLPSSSSSSSQSESASFSSHSHRSSLNSLSNSAPKSSNCSENEVNLVDRFKKQKSPDNSLRGLRTNDETKTSCESHKEVKPDSRDIREEIKVEFERQHKYIQSRDFIKKSPEDSGFESFQQSSVEQNSNQDSDEDDVIATFSTVMEVENEGSTFNDDQYKMINIEDGQRDYYSTQNLFTEAAEARTRSRRLREESLKELGEHLCHFQRTVLADDQQSCDIPSHSSNTVTVQSKSIQQVKEPLVLKQQKQRPLGLQTEVKRGRSVDKSIIPVPGLQHRSISSQPLDVRELAREFRIKETNHDASGDESEDEKKPYVRKAVNVWKARKKEEAKLKKRYQILCNKYQRNQQKPAKL